MNTTSKTYAEQLEALADQYRDETGEKSINLQDLAAWAYSRELLKPYPQDIIKMFAGQFGRALRSIHRTDEQGRVIRAHHAVPIRKDNQLTFEWYKIENMDFAEMQASSQYRRGLIANDVKQLNNDVESWNDNYSDGTLLDLDYNFNLDIAESAASETHPDIDGDDDIL